MKSVLIITSSFPRYDGDFFGPWILDYARELALQDTKVTLVAPNVSDYPDEVTKSKNLTIVKFDYWWPTKYQKLVHPPGMIPQIKSKPWLIFQIPFLLISYFRACRKVFRSTKFDLIHAQWIIPSGFIGALLKLIYKVPLFITSQGAELFLPRYHPYTFFTKWTINRSTKIFPVSHQMGIKLGKLGCNEQKIEVIPNAVNTERFSPEVNTKVRAQYSVQPQTTLILTVRRLVKEKRVNDIIKSIELLSNIDKVHLLIAGDGPERKNLEKLVSELKLKKHITFLGNVNNKDLPEIYAAADMYILSSQQEGLSLSLLEAMSSGLITISTDSTGAQDVIKNGENGFLYPVGDIETLSHIIESEMNKNDEDLATIAQKARQHVIDKFSVKGMVKKWINEYNNSLDEKPI